GTVRLRGRRRHRHGHAGDVLRAAAHHQCAAGMAGPQRQEAGMNHTPLPTHLTEARWVRAALIAIALGFLGLFLALPLAVVFIEAFSRGWDVYKAAVTDPDALAAIRLTLLIAAVSLPLNLVFGVAAAWSITRFQFRGKQCLLTLIDLPFSVSPVVAGLVARKSTRLNSSHVKKSSTICC